MLGVGKRIKKARKAAGLTQAALAKLINVSRSYIGDIETDRHASSLSTLQLIADALHVDIAEFVSEKSTVAETGITNDEVHLLMAYRSLNDDDKRLAQEMIQRFVISTPRARFTATPITSPTPKRKRKAVGW